MIVIPILQRWISPEENISLFLNLTFLSNSIFFWCLFYSSCLRLLRNVYFIVSCFNVASQSYYFIKTFSLFCIDANFLLTIDKFAIKTFWQTFVSRFQQLKMINFYVLKLFRTNNSLQASKLFASLRSFAMNNIFLLILGKKWLTINV